MAWIQAFPTDGTRISQSVAQIQSNWLYIEQTMQKDHYFDNAPAINDGHHKFVHLSTSGDQAIILTGVLYQKNTVTGAAPMLYYRTTASGIMQIPTTFTGTKVLGAAAGTVTLTSFAGKKPFIGTLVAYGTTTGANMCSAAVYWSGANARADQTAVGGIITSIQRSGTNVTVTKTAGAETLRWVVTKTEF